MEKDVGNKTDHPLYKTWENMKSRCFNPNATRYECYGGKDVSVCKEWLMDFWQFVADMGPKPEGTTLDRIDVTGHYTKSNCRWATYKEQEANKRIPRPKGSLWKEPTRWRISWNNRKYSFKTKEEAMHKLNLFRQGNWLILFGLLFIGLLSDKGIAQSILQADRVAFETYRVGTFRDNNFIDSEDRNSKGLAFVLDLGITKYIEWKNRVWTNGNDAKLHTVGWEYDIGVRLHENLSLFHYHHSQHAMDDNTGFDRFPLRNYYGVRVDFIPQSKEK